MFLQDVCLCGLRCLSGPDVILAWRMSLRTALPELWVDVCLWTASTKSLILLVLKKLTHDLIGSMTWNFVAGETSYKLVKKCLLQSSHVFAGCVDTVKMCCDPHMLKKKRFFKMGIVETCHTHKFYRHLFFWIIYFFPFETSATASCGYMLYIYMYIFVIYLFLDINQQILSQPLRICYLSWVLPSDTKKEPMTLTPWMGRIPLRGGCAPGVVRKPGGRQDTKQDDFRYPEPPEI